MIYKIIASGSKGNCTIIENSIAIDMGVSFKALGDYKQRIKVVLLTHCHADHFNQSTIKALAQQRPSIKFICAPFLAKKLYELVGKDRVWVLSIGGLYNLTKEGSIKLSCFKLKHDVPNVGWRIMINGQKCIYATDTGSMEVDGKKIVARNYDLYLIEANYLTQEAINRSIKKKAQGLYSYELRAMNNHLSKEQCDEFLSENMGKNSEFVYMHKHVEVMHDGKPIAAY